MPNHPDKIAKDWYQRRLRFEWVRGHFFQRFELDRATPQVMDGLWADGWRHFGNYFFRDMYNLEDSRLTRVIPLRIQTHTQSLAKDHRRNLAKNSDLITDFKNIKLEAEHYQMFEAHAQRFSKNRPDDIYQFISPQVHIIPCPTQMCEIRDTTGTLLAVSFIDIGAHSMSSIYAMFDPKVAQRGLGIYTILMETKYARDLGKQYLYTGYAHTQNSYYDYKKRFHGTEFYDWQGQWRPLDKLSNIIFPQHKFEKEDIPEELLVSSTDESS